MQKETQPKRRRPWITIILIAVVVVVLLLVFNIREIIDAILNADWFFLGGATVVLLVGYMILALRWRFMLGQKPGARYTFFTMNVANMANLMTFIPVTAIRAALMGGHPKVPIPQSISSVSLAYVLDWVVKFLSLVLALLLGFASSASTMILIVGVVIIVAMLAGIILALTNAEKIAARLIPVIARLPRIDQEQAERLAASFLEGLAGRKSPRDLVVSLLWSILAWICMLAFFYLGLLAFGISHPVNRMLTAVLAAYFFVNPALPYLPGMFQVLLVAPLYLVFRDDPDILLAFSIVLHAILLVIWFGLGALGLRRLDLNFRSMRQQIAASIASLQEDDSTGAVEGGSG